MRELVEKGIIPEGKAAQTIDEIIEDLKLINCSITILAGSRKGDNYMSAIYRIIIRGIDEITTFPNELHIILKCSLRGAFRHRFPHNIAFKNECYMYDTYLPRLYQIQEQCKITDGFRKVAKLHDFSTEDSDEFLILDDMKERGFVMTNRNDTMNLEHCKLVFRQLAWLHGLGFVFKQKHRTDFENVTQNILSPLTNHVDGPDFRNFMKEMAVKALDTLEENSEAHKRFIKFKMGLFKTMDNLKIRDDEYSTVVHNDCWINNILFKYRNERHRAIPIDICFLDWQISELHSPVKDISYFIYNCTDLELRNAHFSELLHYYYVQLAQVIVECNCSIAACYPRSVYEDHIRRYFVHGVVFALITIPLHTSDSNEVPDFCNEDVRHEYHNWMLSISNQNRAIFRKRMGGILIHAIENNII